MLALQDPDLPDASRIRVEARRILESADFNPREGTALPIGEWIREKLESMLRWFGALHAESPFVYWLILVLCLLVLAAIFAHAGLVLSRAFRAPGRGERRASGSRSRRSPSELLAEARQAAARGESARALTLYLRAAVAGLDIRGLVRATETATGREYLGLLRPHTAERGLFERLLGHYEPGVFGGRHPHPESLQECDRIARRLAGESA